MTDQLYVQIAYHSLSTTANTDNNGITETLPL